MQKKAVFQLRCTEEELEAWKSLAAARGSTLSEFIRSLLAAMVSRG